MKKLTRDDSPPVQRLPPTSRPKKRCHFGPKAKRGRSRDRSVLHKKRIRSPPPNPTRRWDVASPWLLNDVHFAPQEWEEISQFPARTTLEPPASIQRTPFDHYEAGPAPAPGENPYRFIQRKLGISAQAFTERINQEVEELLQELEKEKVQEAGPSEKVLSKNECYQMLKDKELTTGTLLGNYRWAADLGRAKWNFEMPNWDPETINLLNAYD